MKQCILSAFMELCISLVSLNTINHFPPLPSLFHLQEHEKSGFRPMWWFLKCLDVPAGGCMVLYLVQCTLATWQHGTGTLKVGIQAPVVVHEVPECSWSGCIMLYFVQCTLARWQHGTGT